MVVNVGERWRKIGEHVAWKVVHIDMENACIGLTGPGPCRAYRNVDFVTFTREWERVND